MPTISELIAHPKTFLKRNALWPAGSFNVKTMGRPDENVWPVKLRRKSMVSCVDKSGAPMGCFEIAEADSLEMVPCYYLPYVPNQTRQMTLGSKADLFFTDTMTGCAFGAAAGPNPVVAHLNYTEGGDPAAKIDNVKIAAEMHKVFAGPPAVSLYKQDYKTAAGRDGNVTVIGVRRGGTWEFVYQRRNAEGSDKHGSLYRLVSVHTVT